jgi:hypothetical protein
MSLTTFFILSLAAQRLHFMWLTQAIFVPARNGIAWLSPFLNYTVNCSVCTAVWSAAIVYVLFGLSWLGQLIDYALALSTGIAITNILMNICEAKIAELMRPNGMHGS